MIGIFVVIIGLLIGSFLNVCVFRIPREESISFPPSHCMNCGTRIKPYDLFPVISYLLLKGKCRKCGERISIRYPIIELTNGIVFLMLYIEFGLTFNFIKYSVLACFLIVIGMIDYDTTDVYSKTTYSGIISAIIFAVVGYFLGNGYLSPLYGGLLGGGLIALIILITHGMGWGDFEICILCGLYLGYKLTIVMLFLSFVVGGLVGIILMITGRKSKKDYIPFGPFIAVGALLTMFFGQGLINWYLKFL